MNPSNFFQEIAIAVVWKPHYANRSGTYRGALGPKKPNFDHVKLQISLIQIENDSKKYEAHLHQRYKFTSEDSNTVAKMRSEPWCCQASELLHTALWMQCLSCCHSTFMLCAMALDIWPLYGIVTTFSTLTSEVFGAKWDAMVQQSYATFLASLI